MRAQFVVDVAQHVADIQVPPPHVLVELEVFHRGGIFRVMPIVRRALTELQASGSDRRSGARHVDPSRGGPKVSERLLEILDDFADCLGLHVHTVLSSSLRFRGRKTCRFNELASNLMDVPTPWCKYASPYSWPPVTRSIASLVTISVFS
jgi:hypothetical protein